MILYDHDQNLSVEFSLGCSMQAAGPKTISIKNLPEATF